METTPEYREKCRAYYRANKEVVLARQKVYYAATKNARRARWKTYYEANKDTLSEAKRSEYEQNSERIRQRGVQYRKVHGPRVAVLHRARRYGLSIEDTELLLTTTYCEICETNEPVGSGWNVDHCHTTGKVGGILCSNCNTGLGLFKDDAARLRRAADYIDERR